MSLAPNGSESDMSHLVCFHWQQHCKEKKKPSNKCWKMFNAFEVIISSESKWNMIMNWKTVCLPQKKNKKIGKIETTKFITAHHNKRWLSNEIQYWIMFFFMQKSALISKTSVFDFMQPSTELEYLPQNMYIVSIFCFCLFLISF